MHDGRVLMGETSYRPIAFHDQDASELVRYVHERQGGGVPSGSDLREVPAPSASSG